MGSAAGTACGCLRPGPGYFGPRRPNPYAHARIGPRLVTGPGYTHGCQVLVNEQVLVDQPTMPDRTGQAGFATPDGVVPDREQVH